MTLGVGVFDRTIPYVLSVPSGPSVPFNDATSGLIIEEITPGPPLRTTLDPRPQTDAGIIGDAFLGGYLLTMQGRVTAEGGFAWRRQLLEQLQGVLVAMLRKDGELYWTTDDWETTYFYGMRLNEDLLVRAHPDGEHVKSWEFQLVSKYGNPNL